MSQSPRYTVELLNKHHNRSGFCSGIDSLDVYLHRYARQDIRKNVTATFILAAEDGFTIAGYYTLSAASIQLNDLSEDLLKKLPKYPVVPATLIGRLAVDKRYRGQGLGEWLLMDALQRSYHHSKEIASFAVVVDAIDLGARKFYEHYGFIPFQNFSLKLLLSMELIERLFI